MSSIINHDWAVESLISPRVERINTFSVGETTEQNGEAVLQNEEFFLLTPPVLTRSLTVNKIDEGVLDSYLNNKEKNIICKIHTGWVYVVYMITKDIYKYAVYNINLDPFSIEGKDIVKSDLLHEHLLIEEYYQVKNENNTLSLVRKYK